MKHLKTINLVLAFFVVTLLCAFLDQWAYDHLYVQDIYHNDWAMGLKQLGTLYPWIIGAVLLFLADKHQRLWRNALPRAALMFMGPLFSGAIMAALKWFFHRPRPPSSPEEIAAMHGQVARLWDVVLAKFQASEWTFEAMRHASTTAKQSFPSGHSATIWGAAFTLAYLFPRTQWVWFALAGGCALTRVMDRAHHLSDVVFSIGVAWLGVKIAIYVFKKISKRLEKPQA